MNYGGETPTFWIALLITALVKWLFSERTSVKQSLGGIVSGMLIAYFGHDFVIRTFDFISAEDDIVVAIVLVLTGEHLTRALLTLSPEKAIKIWRGK